MTQFNFSRLERVELRSVWVSEDSDFTPWMARKENLTQVGELLNLELELETMEGWAGPFRGGLICRDTLHGTFVIIDNQLEDTDQRHLGQLLTYAAELKAGTIVWVAAHFTNEHLNTLNWLNTVTDKSINFFGLEVELWRIADSPLAPKFKLVCKPNDWTERIPPGMPAAAQTPPAVDRRPEPEESTLEDQLQLVEDELQHEYQIVENQLQLEYWQALRHYLETSGSFIRPGTPRSQNWMNFDVGHWRLRLTAFNNMRDGGIGVQLVIREGDVEMSYHTLYQQRAEIGAEIGEALEWRDLPENRQGQITLRRYNADPTNREQWAEQQVWFKTKLEAFDRAFRARISAFSADD